MATWLIVTVWILWFMWTAVEVLSLLAVYLHNSDKLKVALTGCTYHYGPIAKTTSILYIVLTVAWFCYNLV